MNVDKPPEPLESFTGDIISVKLSQAVVVKDANGDRWWFRLSMDTPVVPGMYVTGFGEPTGDNGEGLTFLRNTKIREEVPPQTRYDDDNDDDERVPSLP